MVFGNGDVDFCARKWRKNIEKQLFFIHILCFRSFISTVYSTDWIRVVCLCELHKWCHAFDWIHWIPILDSFFGAKMKSTHHSLSCKIFINVKKSMLKYSKYYCAQEKKTSKYIENDWHEVWNVDAEICIHVLKAPWEMVELLIKHFLYFIIFGMHSVKKCVSQYIKMYKRTLSNRIHGKECMGEKKHCVL